MYIYALLCVMCTHEICNQRSFMYKSTFLGYESQFISFLLLLPSPSSSTATTPYRLAFVNHWAHEFTKPNQKHFFPCMFASMCALMAQRRKFIIILKGILKVSLFIGMNFSGIIKTWQRRFSIFNGKWKREDEHIHLHIRVPSLWCFWCAYQYVCECLLFTFLLLLLLRLLLCVLLVCC